MGDLLWAVATAAVDVWRLVVAVVARPSVLAGAAAVVVALFVAAHVATRAIKRELDELDRNR